MGNLLGIGQEGRLIGHNDGLDQALKPLVDPVGGGDLSDGLLLPQNLLHDLRLEGGAVTLSPAVIIHPILAPSSV